MATICGIELSHLANDPAPEELAEVVANWGAAEQAIFLMALGEKLRFACGPRVAIQWQAIAESICGLEEELADGSASQLIEEIQSRLAFAKSTEAV
jgi:hypothetical protein